MTAHPGENVHLILSEYTDDGSIYTYDYEADAGYVNVQPAPTAARVGRTVEIGDGINIDLTDEGEFYGIERIGGPIEKWVLMRVVRHLAAAQFGSSGGPDER